MRGPWRAYLALALHLCFVALPLCTVLGLAAIALYIVRYSTGAGLRAGLAAVTVAALFGVGLQAILRARVRPIGVVVSRSGQPRIWKMAETAASVTGTRAPDEIRLTTEPSAAVREDTGLLGLRTRVRYLEIGLPLIGGLTVSELHAVVTREMARLGRGAPATARRVAMSLDHTLTNLVGGPTKWLFAGYARLYLATAAATRRELEARAPSVAVKLTGKRVALTAMHKTTAAEIAWDEYVKEYLTMATTAEHTPDVLPGFRSFLENPQRKRDLAERAKRAIAQQRTGAAGERLPQRKCIELIKRLPERERKRDDHAAVALISDPRENVPEFENRLLIDGLGPRLPWPELARTAGAAHVAHQAALLSSAVSQSGVGEGPAIGAILAAIHRGEAADLINPVLNPGLDPDRLSEAVIDTMTELLGDTVVDALITAGRAHHELDWGGPSVVRLAGGKPLDPDRLVRPAVTDPRLVPGLHRVLVDLGVPLNHARPPAGEPEPELAGIVSAVRFAGRRYDMLVTDRGLLFVRSDSSAFRHLLTGVLARARQAENERFSRLADTGIDELREDSSAQWLDSRDVASAEMRTQRSQWRLHIELYLDEYAVSSLDPAGITRDGDDTATVELSSTSDSVERGDPYGGLGEVMGARLTRDDLEEVEVSKVSPKRVIELG